MRMVKPMSGVLHEHQFPIRQGLAQGLSICLDIHHLVV